MAFPHDLDSFGSFTSAATPAAVTINLGWIPDVVQIWTEATTAGQVSEGFWTYTMGAGRAVRKLIIADNGSSGNKNQEFITSNGITVVDTNYVSPRIWTASTAYSVGDIVHPTINNGYFYKCTTAGTSGSSEPTWGTTVGGTTSDGTVTWTCISQGDPDATVRRIFVQGFTIGTALQVASTRLHWYAKRSARGG